MEATRATQTLPSRKLHPDQRGGQPVQETTFFPDLFSWFIPSAHQSALSSEQQRVLPWKMSCPSRIRSSSRASCSWCWPQAPPALLCYASTAFHRSSSSPQDKSFHSIRTLFFHASIPLSKCQIPLVFWGNLQNAFRAVLTPSSVYSQVLKQNTKDSLGQQSKIWKISRYFFLELFFS